MQTPLIVASMPTRPAQSAKPKPFKSEERLTDRVKKHAMRCCSHRQHCHLYQSTMSQNTTTNGAHCHQNEKETTPQIPSTPAVSQV